MNLEKNSVKLHIFVYGIISRKNTKIKSLSKIETIRLICITIKYLITVLLNLAKHLIDKTYTRIE